jgi:hypothetical protein
MGAALVLRCVAAVAIGLALFALNSSRAQLATAVLLAHVQPPSVDPPPLESFSSPPPPPPPPPAAVQSAPLGRHLPAPPASLTLTFGTVTLKHFVYNWLRHAARVPRLTYAVVTFDAALEQLCQSWGEPSISGHELLAGRGAEAVLVEPVAERVAARVVGHHPGGRDADKYRVRSCAEPGLQR